MPKVQEVWQYETSQEFNDAERAALRFAQAAGKVPNAVSDADFAELRRHFDEDEIIEIVAAIAFLGFLNRWNDTLATPLEAAPRDFAERHLAAAGWTLGKHSSGKVVNPLRSAPLRSKPASSSGFSIVGVQNHAALSHGRYPGTPFSDFATSPQADRKLARGKAAFFWGRNLVASPHTRRCKHMRRYAVSPRVNNVANDDPQCVDPMEVSQLSQPGLF